MSLWIPWVVVRYVGAALVAIMMFCGVTAWRYAETNPAAGVTFLYTVPIALLAVTFGFRGGALGAGVGATLTGVWAYSEGAPIDDSGYLIRATTMLAVGVIVGWQADRRHRIEREANRWFSMSGELVCVASFDGHFTRVNPSWTRLLGYTERELLETPSIEFVHPDDVESTLARHTVAAQHSADSTRYENRYRAKDGSWHWLHWTARSDGRLIYAAARDITEQKRLEHQLIALATVDPLTGAANRRGWDARIDIEIPRAKRSGRPLCVVMIDLDNLKALNDTHGHAVGDELLAATAKAWVQEVRAGDLLARMGGDEFALLLPDCPEDDAAGIVGRMRASTPVGQGFSAGVAQWDGAETASTLLRRADEALYRAKAQGRGRTVLEPSRSGAA